MKYLFLLVFSLVQLVNLVSGQGIRAITDTISKQASTAAQFVTPVTYTGRQIEVGRGGGFTGFATTYYLLDNGKLFRRQNRDTTFTLLGQRTITQTKRMFSAIENTCKIKKTKFNHPGNRYTFVQWRKGKQRYRVAWGMPGHTVPATYPKFVNSLMTMIPASPKQK